MKLIIIRHGQTDANAQHLVQGQASISRLTLPAAVRRRLPLNAFCRLLCRLYIARQCCGHVKRPKLSAVVSVVRSLKRPGWKKCTSARRKECFRRKRAAVIRTFLIGLTVNANPTGGRYTSPAGKALTKVPPGRCGLWKILPEPPLFRLPGW